MILPFCAVLWVGFSNQLASNRRDCMLRMVARLLRDTWNLRVSPIYHLLRGRSAMHPALKYSVTKVYGNGPESERCSAIATCRVSDLFLSHN